MRREIVVLVARGLDVPNSFEDVPNFIKDVPNFLKDVPNFLKDIPNFLKNVPMVPKSILGWRTTSNHLLRVLKGTNRPWEGR